MVADLMVFAAMPVISSACAVDCRFRMDGTMIACSRQTTRMRLLFPFALLLVAAAMACKKKDDSSPTPSTSVACGIPGMRLQGTIGSDAFCANTSLFADQAIVLTANGIMINGSTFTMELDSVSVGSFAMQADVNSVLYTDPLGLAWRTIDGGSTTLTIGSHDTSGNRIQGSISGSLFSPIGGASRSISASFDLTYTE